MPHFPPQFDPSCPLLPPGCCPTFARHLPHLGLTFARRLPHLGPTFPRVCPAMLPTLSPIPRALILIDYKIANPQRVAELLAEWGLMARSGRGRFLMNRSGVSTVKPGRVEPWIRNG